MKAAQQWPSLKRFPTGEATTAALQLRSFLQDTKIVDKPPVPTSFWKMMATSPEKLRMVRASSRLAKLHVRSGIPLGVLGFSQGATLLHFLLLLQLRGSDSEPSDPAERPRSCVERPHELHTLAHDVREPIAIMQVLLSLCVCVSFKVLVWFRCRSMKFFIHEKLLEDREETSSSAEKTVSNSLAELASIVCDTVKFGIFVGGPPVVKPNRPQVSAKIAFPPTLHVIGESDSRVPPPLQEQLSRDFDEPHFFRHEGAHSVPTSSVFAEKLTRFVQAAVEAV
ncbi:unnamed protein product [Amoebophrya sp. A25]|nr:unnamed protein product [Amoebophrya sp. A25]|eukprot:GSA25T00018210001.1